ncbi:hypothetical protein Gotri_010544 [Gossypium trilobum]|nr:hypothetical protein [Gossypium trilobum]
MVPKMASSVTSSSLEAL